MKPPARWCVITEAQCRVIIRAVEFRLPRIIRHGYDLANALEFLSEAQRDVVFEEVQNRKPSIIQYERGIYQSSYRSSDSLGHRLRYFSEAQCRVIIRDVQDQLPHIILCGNDLGKTLKHLSEAQRDVVFEATKDLLPLIINEGSDLDHVFLYLTAEQRAVVLRSIKGKLHQLKAGIPNDADYKAQVDAYLQTTRHGFFSTPRAEAINIGSLSSKLGKYIESRHSEETFHWDFLGIMAFVHWLSGEPWVKAKDTKIAAATYALHAHQNEDACLVRLAQLDELPDRAILKESNTNSYLLVGESGRPKQLYYVDYEGNTTRISMTDVRAVENYFSEKKGVSLTYDALSQGLKPSTRNPLPTDMQLKALREGLLGDIMMDADVEHILKGTPASQDSQAVSDSSSTISN